MDSPIPSPVLWCALALLATVTDSGTTLLSMRVKPVERSSWKTVTLFPLHLSRCQLKDMTVLLCLLAVILIQIGSPCTRWRLWLQPKWSGKGATFSGWLLATIATDHCGSGIFKIRVATFLFALICIWKKPVLFLTSLASFWQNSWHKAPATAATMQQMTNAVFWSPAIVSNHITATIVMRAREYLKLFMGWGGWLLVVFSSALKPSFLFFGWHQSE